MEDLWKIGGLAGILGLLVIVFLTFFVGKSTKSNKTDTTKAASAKASFYSKEEAFAFASYTKDDPEEYSTNWYWN